MLHAYTFISTSGCCCPRWHQGTGHSGRSCGEDNDDHTPGRAWSRTARAAPSSRPGRVCGCACDPGHSANADGHRHDIGGGRRRTGARRCLSALMMRMRDAGSVIMQPQDNTVSSFDLRTTRDDQRSHLTHAHTRGVGPLWTTLSVSRSDAPCSRGLSSLSLLPSEV